MNFDQHFSSSFRIYTALTWGRTYKHQTHSLTAVRRNRSLRHKKMLVLHLSLSLSLSLNSHPNWCFMQIQQFAKFFYISTSQITPNPFIIQFYFVILSVLFINIYSIYESIWHTTFHLIECWRLTQLKWCVGVVRSGWIIIGAGEMFVWRRWADRCGFHRTGITVAAQCVRIVGIVEEIQIEFTASLETDFGYAIEYVVGVDAIWRYRCIHRCHIDRVNVHYLLAAMRLAKKTGFFFRPLLLLVDWAAGWKLPWRAFTALHSTPIRECWKFRWICWSVPFFVLSYFITQIHAKHKIEYINRYWTALNYYTRFFFATKIAPATKHLSHPAKEQQNYRLSKLFTYNMKPKYAKCNC